VPLLAGVDHAQERCTRCQFGDDHHEVRVLERQLVAGAPHDVKEGAAGNKSNTMSELPKSGLSTVETWMSRQTEFR
jgi:hypothetical protein